ncbi:unnamed protein product [Gemmata massiliana]|uniref:Uncharacterized protein n=1 Tax=Gemmata massiliana TaxID=1210884 RepID=A0A6P2CTG6_9BACT|nr:hypothetical protein [Gemmata massiliana]VTR91676.1 unnamed protein product [Gemmata massiliana]
MPNEQQHPQPGGLRKNLNLTFNLFMSLSWLLRTAFTKPGTMGYREARSLNGWWSLGMLFLWAGLSHSQVLAYLGLPFALVVMIEHRVKSVRGTGIHTYSMGESKLARWFGPRAGRWAEAALALGTGALVAPVDKGAGMYLMCAGLGHAFTLAFVYAKEQAIQDDLDDAVIEGAHRASRREERPLF